MTIAEIKKALECCHTKSDNCDECPLNELLGDYCDDVLLEEILKVWDNMIPIGAVEQIKWERDMAMQQLEEHGIPFCGVADDVVKVVRCKDCKFCLIHTQWCKRLNKMTNGNWFCAAGERKEQSDG